VDTLTFLFDFGVAGQLSWFNDGINKEKHLNGNLEYASLLFPVHQRVAISAGILPYSFVGYNFGSVSEDVLPYTEQFIGVGGLNELYLGLSIDIWKKRLSVGTNVSYLFGNVTHNQYLQFASSTGASASTRIQKLTVSDINLDFGIQYTHPLSLRESFTLGVAFSPTRALNVTSSDVRLIGNSTAGADTTLITNQAFDTPNSFGFGLSYVKQKKLTLAADFLFEEWSQARFFDKKNGFKDRIRVAVGGEFIPNYQNKAFFSRVQYRAGLHYSNSYLNINQKSYNEMGAGIGFGLPLIDNRSYINLSVEYVKIKPETRALIDEQYFRFTLNYTFNEMWFRKFKM
jgi:hypothetical protein